MLPPHNGHPLGRGRVPGDPYEYSLKSCSDPVSNPSPPSHNAAPYRCATSAGAVACDWAGAVMPENHEKSEVISDGPTDRPTDRHSEL